MAAEDPNAELFERWCAHGDTDALARVFDATAPRLLALAVHLSGNVADAEDLVQATFLTAIERGATFDRERQLEPWLAGILSNHARDLRKASVRAQDVAHAPDRSPVIPIDEAEESENREVVAAAVDKLEEPYRSVLILAVRHSMSPAEIAYALQRSPGAVRVQLHRGREQLRRLLPVGMFVGALAARGLAEVRASVLARAEVLGSALRVGSIAGGVLVGKKLVAALAVLVLALFVGWRLRPGDVPSPLARNVATPVHSALESSQEEAVGSMLAVASGTDSRTAVPSAPVLASNRVHIRGRVVDAESGAGIGAAEVSMYAPQRTRLSEFRRRWSDRLQVESRGQVHGIVWPRFGGNPDPSGRPDGELSEQALIDGEEIEVYAPPSEGMTALASARSDGDGWFDIDAPESLGFLTCDAHGYSRRERALAPNEINRARAGELTITVAMSAPRHLSGYLVDRSMQRIARSVRLSFYGHLCGSVTHSPAVEGAKEPRDPELDRQCDTWVVQTRPDGSFDCSLPALLVLPSSLGPGFTCIGSWIVADDGTSRTAKAWLETGTAETFAIELAAVSSIRVSDRDSHAPIEDVHLRCKSASSGAVLRRGSYFAREGRLRLSSEQVGWSGMVLPEAELAECLCTVWATGYEPQTQRLPNLTEGYVVEFELQHGRAAGVEGVVRDAERAVSGAAVALFERGPGPWTQSVWSGISTARSDSSGRFRLEAPAGRYLLQLRTGETEEWRAVEIPCNAALEFDLSQNTRLLVALRDPSGAPCTGLPVVLSCVDGRWLRARTDEAGTASFSRLPSGKQTLLYSEVKEGTPEKGDHTLEVEVIAGREERVEVTVSAGPRHARLVVEGVTSLVDWRACAPDAGARTFGSPVGLDGRIPIDIRGCQLLAVESPDHRQWEWPLPKDAPDGYVLRVVPDGPGYEGTLCGISDGNPLVNVRVFFGEPWDTRDRTATTGVDVTDGQGRFRVTGLDDRPYRIWFENPSGSQELARVQIDPRERPGSPPTRLGLVIPRQQKQQFENLASIEIRGVVRSASAGTLPARGTLRSEIEKPGYTLLVDVPFAVREDGQYELRAPGAARYSASLGGVRGKIWPRINWTAAAGVDTEVHDFELP